MLAAAAFALGYLAATATAFAATVDELPLIDEPESIQLPGDWDHLDFYLITVDVGDQVWNNFGHTALRVIDRNTDSDMLFNWGLFDTSAGLVPFVLNFMRGIMDYQLGVFPPEWELARYQQEQRTVWQDRINLSRSQKETLYRRLAWNLRDENIVYSYDYFDDNCTTRVRDYLDEALQGQIERKHRALTQVSYREEVRSHYASIPLISVSLDILMNQGIDQRLNQWQQMFLPLELRRHLLTMPSAVFENGQRLPLLSDSERLTEFPSPQGFLDGYYFVAVLYLPLLLLLLSIGKQPLTSLSSQPGFTLRAPALNYRLLGLVGCLLALASGIYGLIMLLAWLFSAHADLHANINLLLFWPTDLLGLAISLRWLLRGQAARISMGLNQWASIYLGLRIMSILIYLLLGVSGLLAQNTGAVMLYCAPLMLLYTTIAWMTGLKPVRTFRFS
ncbi:MAG: DUF4105 domain-containing protein [Pseudomonadales bacterium]|nr:DUF4105 domain-containing protein [Pseudomonadales bacterium]